MRWPWKRQTSSDQLVVSWSGQTLAYVLARAAANGVYQVLKLGVERQGGDGMDALVQRLQDLGLKALDTQVMLRPEQYQLLQIESPNVPPAELQAAARYQIREMIQTSVDDVTIDVMRVGDDQQKGKGHLFVVVANNAVVQRVHELGGAMRWMISVIDIQETAQRNLQNALTAHNVQPGHANAALVLVEGEQAVLTFSANEELFYSRRFSLPEGFLTMSWGQQTDTATAPVTAVAASSSFLPVDEYVPDYSVGGVSFGKDHSGATANHQASSAAATQVGADNDQAQRFLDEVQRSLDVWDRTWSSKPLESLRVYAGARSEELATWLAARNGQMVLALDVNALFPGFESASASDQAQCLPLLGVLLRSESRRF